MKNVVKLVNQMLMQSLFKPGEEHVMEEHLELHAMEAL